MRTLLSIVFILTTFTLAANLDAFESTTAHALPSVSSVLPDTTPVDLSTAPDGAAAIKAPRPADVKHVSAPVLVWTCGAPRALLSDTTATVRHCSYVAR